MDGSRFGVLKVIPVVVDIVGCRCSLGDQILRYVYERFIYLALKLMRLKCKVW